MIGQYFFFLMKKRIILIFVLIASLVFFGGFLFYQYNLIGICRKDCRAHDFVVPQGDSLNSVLDKLQKEKIIRSAFFAKIYLKLTNFKGQIQAGDYKLNPADGVNKIIGALQRGTLDFWVTIPEGWRAEQVYEEIEKARKGDSSADQYNSEKENIYKQDEGYLFPDTYLIPRDANDKNIVVIMKSNFQNRLNQILGAENTDFGPENTVKIGARDLISVKELITLASLVEREAKTGDERSIIAGIIYKRWRAGWPLQVDATVQYAVGIKGAWWKKDLTLEDLSGQSPFNTYINSGLPPAPICNPGLAAITAVINPKQTDYWFYVTGKDGVTHFAKDLNGHNLNIQNYSK